MPRGESLPVKGSAPRPVWQRDLLLLVLALGLLALWNTPWVWPLKVLVVLFHETGHALATVLTGGEVVALSVSANESGETRSAGGWPLVTLNAGYLGSLGWGCLLLWGSRRATGAQALAAALAFFFLAVALFWVRPILSFGFLLTGSTALMFGTLARWGGDGFAALVLRIIGIFSVLYALGDVVDDVLLRPGAPSDAKFLQERTGIPSLVWGLGWSVISLATLRLFASRLR